MARDKERDERQRDPKFLKELGRPSPEMMKFYNQEREAAKARSRRGKGELWDGLGQGDNLIRILPSLTDKPFFKYLGQHWGSFGEKNLPVYCPKLTIAKDLECPICDFVEEVKAKSESKKELDYAAKLAVRPSWLVQILDRDEDDDKPKLYFFGATSIYLGIMDLITGRYPDLMSLRDGYDIVLNRVGKTMTDTRYTIAADRDPTEVDEAVLDQMIDLEEYVIKRVFDPKDISRILDDGVDPMDIVKELEGEARGDDDEDDRDRGGRRGRDRERGRDERDDDRGRGSTRGDRERSTRDRDEQDDHRPVRGRDREDERGDRDRDRPSRDRDREPARDRVRERDDADRGSGRERERADEDRDRDRNRDDERSTRDRGGRDSREDRERGREDQDRTRDRDERPRGGRERDRDEEPHSRGRDSNATDDRHASGNRNPRRDDAKGRYDDEAEAELDRLKKASGARGKK